MQANRPATGVSPSTVAPMPQDAAIVDQRQLLLPVGDNYFCRSATTPSGRLMMTRQTAAPAAARPASGWFFSQIVADAGTWRATSLTASAGDYSLGPCIGCHASAVDNFTYVSTSNLLGQALPLADWTPASRPRAPPICPPPSPRRRPGNCACRSMTRRRNSSSTSTTALSPSSRRTTSRRPRRCR
jgi:hypothetical protein